MTHVAAQSRQSVLSANALTRASGTLASAAPPASRRSTPVGQDEATRFRSPDTDSKRMLAYRSAPQAATGSPRNAANGLEATRSQFTDVPSEQKLDPSPAIARS